jgi:hypothetical protein
MESTMNKITAMKEARIAALYKGGTWYVTQRGKRYKAISEDAYRNSHADGKVIDTFTAEKVRRTVPPYDRKPAKRGAA